MNNPYYNLFRKGKSMSKWKELTMSQRAEVIKMAVQSGITSLDAIRKSYNEYSDRSSFAIGGDLEENTYDANTGKVMGELPEVIISAPSRRTQALIRSRKATSPNTNFTNAMDLPIYSSYPATIAPKLFGIDPHTCLNTVTGFYDPNNTVANNANLWANPQDYGYEQIPQTEAKPGDIIILSNKDNYPKHAVMFDSVAKEDGEKYGYPINKGDTLVNYSNGGRGKNDYRLKATLKRFDDSRSSGGDFSGERRYYKYVGLR